MMHLQAIIARNNAPSREAPDDNPPVPGIGIRFHGKGPSATPDVLSDYPQRVDRDGAAHDDMLNRATRMEYIHPPLSDDDTLARRKL